MELKETMKLSWEDVATMISAQLFKMLGSSFTCGASCDGDGYWGITLTVPISVSELIRALMESENAHQTQIKKILKGVSTTQSIDMELSEMLLKNYLGQDWESSFCNDTGIFLMNPYGREFFSNYKKTIKLNDDRILVSSLKNLKELLEYLQENGATHEALMDFCKDYRELYNNELCWSYPISDGKHQGTFLVMVQEGVLSLPYDDIDKESYEIFCLEDARMCKLDDLDIFLSDWKRFSDDLQSSISQMMEYLRLQELQEVQNEPEN